MTHVDCRESVGCHSSNEMRTFDRVYPFLDWNQGPIAAAYYLGIAVNLFIGYFILYFIHKYRNMWLASYSNKVNEDLEEYQERDLLEVIV